MEFYWQAVVVADFGQKLLTMTSVPKTFGIKYGTLVLSLVLMNRVVCCLFVIGLKMEATGIVILSLVMTIVALIIAHFFSEKLDIDNLRRRNLVVFQDFGLTRGETLNFKRDDTIIPAEGEY